MHLDGAYWRDIGTPAEYRLATEDALSGRIRLRGAAASGLCIEGDVRLGKNVGFGRGVRIVGPTVIGDNVSIGDETHVERSIVWDSVTIGDRVRVHGSIVGREYDVPDDTVLVDRIVANA